MKNQQQKKVTKIDIYKITEIHYVEKVEVESIEALLTNLVTKYEDKLEEYKKSSKVLIIIVEDVNIDSKILFYKI